jgi:hypothetical protein
MRMLKLSAFALALVVALAALVMPVQAQDDTFEVTVYHGINGTALGLSKELPVVASIQLNGAPLADLPLVFKDKITTDLPAGEYLITVVSAEAGPLPSMTVGPVEIPAGAEVTLHAKLSADKTPIIKASIK